MNRVAHDTPVIQVVIATVSIILLPLRLTSAGVVTCARILGSVQTGHS